MQMVTKQPPAGNEGKGVPAGDAALPPSSIAMEIDNEQSHEVSNALKVQKDVSQDIVNITPVDPTSPALKENGSIPADDIPPFDEAPSGQSEEPLTHSNKPNFISFRIDVGFIEDALPPDGSDSALDIMVFAPSTNAKTI